MTAAEVKDALRRRHPALIPGFTSPGAWTCIEEFRNIDLLAVSAWSSAERYARIGYEVKVSRSDYKRELQKPHKRASNVAWCNQFFIAIPAGLLKPNEIVYRPPPGLDDVNPFEPERCAGLYGSGCVGGMVHFGVGKMTRHESWRGHWAYHGARGRRGYYATCPVCAGTGVIAPPLVERCRAPKLWIPDDVGLIEVSERGCTVKKPSPKRREVPAPGPLELGQLLRWVSVRPDPRHRP